MLWDNLTVKNSTQRLKCSFEISLLVQFSQVLHSGSVQLVTFSSIREDVRLHANFKTSGTCKSSHEKTCPHTIAMSQVPTLEILQIHVLGNAQSPPSVGSKYTKPTHCKMLQVHLACCGNVTSFLVSLLGIDLEGHDGRGSLVAYVIICVCCCCSWSKCRAGAELCWCSGRIGCRFWCKGGEHSWPSCWAKKTLVVLVSPGCHQFAGAKGQGLSGVDALQLHLSVSVGLGYHQAGSSGHTAAVGLFQSGQAHGLRSAAHSQHL